MASFSKISSAPPAFYQAFPIQPSMTDQPFKERPINKIFVAAITDLMRHMGYEESDPDLGHGSCAGIAAMGLMSVLNHKVPEFNTRLEKIKLIYAHMQYHKIYGEVGDAEIRAFFDGVVFAQQGLNGRLLCQQQQEINSSSELSNLVFSYISSIEVEKKGGIEQVFCTSCVANFQELTAYMQTLIEMLNVNKVSAGFIISTASHAIGLGYDVNENNFFIIDFNHLPIFCADSFNKAVESIYCLVTNQKPDSDTNWDKQAVIGLQLFSWKDKIKLTFPPFFTRIKEEQLSLKAQFSTDEKECWSIIAASMADEPTLEQILRFDNTIKDSAPLKTAASAGSLTCVKQLMECKTNQTVRETYKISAVIISVIENGHLTILEHLFSQLPLDTISEEAKKQFIFQAIKYRQPKILNFFKSKRFIKDVKYFGDKTVLHVASSISCQDCVQLLIEEGVDIDEQDQLGFSALHYACQHNKITNIATLLRAGANPNLITKEGNTPLHIVAVFNNLDAIKLLISAGAHIEAKNFGGYSPLHLAFHRKQWQAVSELARWGAKVDTQCNRLLTPLAEAVFLGDEIVARYLISIGADLNFFFQEGNLAHLAVYKHNKAMIELVIKLGINFTLQNAHGQTPLELAAELNIPQIENVLRSAIWAKMGYSSF